MTGIMKKTEAQRLKMVIDQRDSQIEAAQRALTKVMKERDEWEAGHKHELDLRMKAEAEIRALKAEKTPAQLHADRVAQMISEDRD